MVVDAGHRHAPGAHRLAQHAQPTQIGDVEHDDRVGPAELLHRLLGSIHPGQVLEQELEPRGRGRGIGDDRLDPAVAQQVGQPGLAAEAVAVRIHVGCEANPLPRHERRGQRPRGGDPIGGERERHAGNITGRSGRRAVGRRAAGGGRSGGWAVGRLGGWAVRTSPIATSLSSTPRGIYRPGTHGRKIPRYVRQVTDLRRLIAIALSDRLPACPPARALPPRLELGVPRP